MVALGGCAWLLGGMCVVAPRGHVLRRGACMAKGCMHGKRGCAW